MSKPDQIKLQIKKNAIIRVLKYTGNVYNEDDPPEIILSKLEMAKGSEAYEDFKPLIFMLEQTICKLLNVTWIDYSEYLTTIYIDFEDYSDFDLILGRMRHERVLQKKCSVDFYLSYSIWFPYQLDIEENENLMSIHGKILNLDLGDDTRKFYETMVPCSITDVELAKAEVKDDYLNITVRSKETISLEYFEEVLTERYEWIKDGRLID